MIRRLATLALLLLLVPSQASLEVQQGAAVNPSTMAPPLTLAALHANTVIGASGTSATTSPGAIPLALGPQALEIVHGAVAQDVILTVTSKSGYGALDTVSLTLGSTLLVVASATSTPVSMAQVDVGTVSDVTLTVGGACVGTCTLNVEFRINPDGAGGAPVIKYSYTLLVT